MLPHLSIYTMTEQTDENAVVKYTEYETCIVQEWTVENEEEYEE